MEYISKYSNGKQVSAAQYITEIICENKAKMEKKDLHFRFWQTSTYWQKFYKNQIATANKLLKIHKPQAIIAALKDKKGQRIFSLRAPHLKAIIEHHEQLLDAQKKEHTEIDRVDHKTYKSRTDFKKGKNIVDLLNEE